MMYFTIWSIASAIMPIPLPTALPLSPRVCRQKPKKIVNIISGSIARREMSCGKSSTVNALTIWSAVLNAWISPVALSWIDVPAAGGNNVTVMSIKMAAIAPVTKNTMMSAFITRPSRSMEDICATALHIVEKTNGTTIMNIALMKTSPSGLKTSASFPITAPIKLPRHIENMRMIGNRYDFQKLFEPSSITESLPSLNKRMIIPCKSSIMQERLENKA